jgi:hypothetical protein
MKTTCFLALGAVLISNMAYASGIRVQLPATIHGEDACGQITGQWQGGGTVKKWPLTCHYSGVADVKMASLTNFVMDVDLHRDGGSNLCPSNETITLPGTCENGAVSFNTDDANLHGSMNDAGNAVDLSGTVTFSVSGSRVTADVDDMHLDKK